MIFNIFKSRTFKMFLAMLAAIILFYLFIYVFIIDNLIPFLLGGLRGVIFY